MQRKARTMMRPTMCNSVARHRFNPDVPTTFSPSYLDGSLGPEYATRAEAEADFNANPNGGQTMHESIEDESGDTYGISYDQVQADYHRLWEIGVNDGTHRALLDKGKIVIFEFFHENDRTRHMLDSILPDSFKPYWDGYHAAYANTCTPEILACFEVKA